jgi:hypothetical protein
MRGFGGRSHGKLRQACTGPPQHHAEFVRDVRLRAFNSPPRPLGRCAVR